MPRTIDKNAVFKALRTIISEFSGRLMLVTDSDTNYYLNTHHVMKNKKPMFFGAVQVRKNYVSYHLMPVYVNPCLLDSLSESLKKRMQGKSCFNFKSVEVELFEELAALTKAGYQSYVEKGYIEPEA